MFESFQTIDIVLGAILIVSTVYGCIKGLAASVISVMGIAAVFFITIGFGDDIYIYFAPMTDHVILDKALAYFGTGIGMLFCVAGIKIVLNRVVLTHMTGPINHIFGGIFGFGRAYVLLLCVVVLAGMTSAPASSVWRQSHVLPMFTHSAAWLRTHYISDDWGAMMHPDIVRMATESARTLMTTAREVTE